MSPTSDKKIVHAALAEARLGTRLMHSDHEYVDAAIGPDISETTTFRRSSYTGEKPPGFQDKDHLNPPFHRYSRYTQPIFTRAEKVLGCICGGYATTYRSGLSAAFAAFVHCRPKRIAIRRVYFGVHETIDVYKRTNPELTVIDIDEPLAKGDLVWLESPSNPTGEVKNIQHYADKAHAASAFLVVDATFAPPPLQDPFQFGADMIMHSGSKYFGGHSDLLCGILVVKSEEEAVQLWRDRTFLGGVMGSLEAFLLLRSLRTHELRVLKQSRTATQLAQWLDRLSRVPTGEEWDGAPGGIVTRVWHGSLQEHEAFVKKQMIGGHSPTFSILVREAKIAKEIPHALAFFTSATSLGGAESLIEQHHVSNPSADPRLIRISVGLEDIEDMKADLRRAFKKTHSGEKANL